MDEDDSGFIPPEGFRRSRRGAFTQHNGPLYHREREGEQVVHGFHVLKRHCNRLGIVHGGMLATFVDGLLGHAVSSAAARPGVTIHLSLDYLAMARAGEWIQGEARVTRLTRDVAFAEARAHVGDRDVIRATSVFKLMQRKRN